MDNLKKFESFKDGLVQNIFNITRDEGLEVKKVNYYESYTDEIIDRKYYSGPDDQWVNREENHYKYTVGNVKFFEIVSDIIKRLGNDVFYVSHQLFLEKFSAFNTTIDNYYLKNADQGNTIAYVEISILK